MPGLNQLKQFTEDVKDIGDEVKIRAQRGEKPAVVPLPEGISEADDSEDFVLGLPEEGETAAAETDSTAEDDLSEETFATPDLDAILNPGSAANTEVPDLSDFLDEPAATQTPETPAETPLEDMDLESLLNSSSEQAEDLPSLDEDMPSLDSFELPAESPESSVSDEAILTDVPEFTENAGEVEIPEEVSQAEDLPALDDDFSFSGEAIDLNTDIPEDIAELDGHPAVENIEAGIPADELSALEDFSEPDAADSVENLFSTDGLDAPVSESADSVENLFSTDGLDAPASESADSVENLFSTDGLDAPASESADSVENLFSTDDLDAPAGTDFNDMFSQEGQAVDASMDVPAESFDLSAMENLDFSNEVPADSEDSFPLTSAPATGGSDDFELEMSDFEIPGFSDTETANVTKKKTAVDVADFNQAVAGKPKNTLTDDEYAVFKKNLASYPLNLRLAIEDLVVKNEFTDDAVFEVIEKVLKKLPARQVATHLEKMLDIAIDVPRDYERRSYAQYEAYKQSFQYQLKNRIIPGAIAGAIICFIGYFLFQAGVAFVYKPLMANMYYKQGYTLLENNEYPQSEEKFVNAVHYKPVKKWFFKYARGYRAHKQYERAAQMYLNILGVFNHDKEAGLEWTGMELYDRANYERAEEIVRRQVLDYHINDKDGYLLLGDIFLEWADTDGSKYEDAREQYATLINLYGPTDLYMSRMMRYFIRTDKLRNVLELKNRFYPNKKSLCAEDWTELSGYLLDKLYGPLSRADEYLRSAIEDVRSMLERAVKADPSSPVAHYNMARYFVNNNNATPAKAELNEALRLFGESKVRTKKNTYREINADRLLGELYADGREYLKAQEIYTNGIQLFQEEQMRTGLEGDENTGLLYSDMGDIEYFISGDMDAALVSYEAAVKNKNDTPSINFRIGAIRYGKQEYDKALAAFIKTAEVEGNDVNLLLSLGNVLSIRGDNFAAHGYYEHLLSLLDKEKARTILLQPQQKIDDGVLVDMYLRVNNNLGVTLYRIARQTGDSSKNAEALVRLSDSIRAWDALTRNQTTMVRLEGSNLAAQNSKYITHKNSDFEPAIYTDIPKTLVQEKILE